MAWFIYSLALITDSLRMSPWARKEAMADESVQPVPWVLTLSILGVGNSSVSSVSAL